jgi:hypothetical protein
VRHGLDIQIGLLPGEGVDGQLELMVLAAWTWLIPGTPFAERSHQTQ